VIPLNNNDLNKKFKIDKLRSRVHYKLRRRYKKSDVDIVVTAVIEEIANILVDGQSVTLEGLGIFKSKVIKDRYRYDINIEKSVFEPKHRIAEFVWSKTYRNRIKDRMKEHDDRLLNEKSLNDESLEGKDE
jgi:nucleoid DNA-binding protein